MTSQSSRAIVLFAHGARDTRWSDTLTQLRHRVTSRAPDAFVAIAFLELQPPTLATALADAIAHGRKRIDIVPVFWASGGHVVNDLPRMIEDFGRAHPDVELRVLPVLSELPGLLDFVADAVVRGQS